MFAAPECARYYCRSSLTVNFPTVIYLLYLASHESKFMILRIARLSLIVVLVTATCVGQDKSKHSGRIGTPSAKPKPLPTPPRSIDNLFDPIPTDEVLFDKADYARFDRRMGWRLAVRGQKDSDGIQRFSYYDVDRITNLGGNKEAWIRTEAYKGDALLNIWLDLNEFDCGPQARIALIEATEYDQNGKVSSKHSQLNREWDRVVPDSIGEHIYNIICRNEKDQERLDMEAAARSFRIGRQFEKNSNNEHAKFWYEMAQELAPGNNAKITSALKRVMPMNTAVPPLSRQTSPPPLIERHIVPPLSHGRANNLPVDASIADDPAVNQMLAVYSPKVRELDAVIGSLKGELRKGGMGAGSLGNFVTDGMRWQASLKLGRPIDVALMNSGGLRRADIGEGDLRARDIFELLPFENALVTLELTGEQLMRLLTTIVARREAQSGARIVYFTKADKTSEIEIAKLRTPSGEKEIDPQATYRVVTIDYLVNVGGERYAVLHEGKNLRALGITLREAMMAYVKSETAAGRTIRPNLDGRFSLNREKSAASDEARPNR